MNFIVYYATLVFSARTHRMCNHNNSVSPVKANNQTNTQMACLLLPSSFQCALGRHWCAWPSKQWQLLYSAVKPGLQIAITVSSLWLHHCLLMLLYFDSSPWVEKKLIYPDQNVHPANFKREFHKKSHLINKFAL